MQGMEIGIGKCYKRFQIPRCVKTGNAKRCEDARITRVWMKPVKVVQSEPDSRFDFDFEHTRVSGLKVRFRRGIYCLARKPISEPHFTITANSPCLLCREKGFSAFIIRNESQFTQFSVRQLVFSNKLEKLHPFLINFNS